MGLITESSMSRVIQVLVFLVAIPLFSFCQNKIDKIDTETTFANYGFYNEQNNHILFMGIDMDTVTGSFKTSIKAKEMDSGMETIIVPDIQLSLPSFGWLDSSHVFYTTSEAIGKPKMFGLWQGYFIKYNIFTQKEDTISSPWYSSDNYVENINSSTNRLFYTIVFGSKEDVIYWNEYLIESEEIRTVKKYKDGGNNHFRILTYQYLPNSKEIIYIKENSKKRELIKLSTIDGKEYVIKSMNLGNPIEASALKGNKLYYLERISPKNEYGYSDLKNSTFVIKSVDINTKRIDTIYSFEKGMEVSSISIFKKNKLLVSVQGNLDEAIVEKKINIASGGDVTVGLNPTSYLFIVDAE